MDAVMTKEKHQLRVPEFLSGELTRIRPLLAEDIQGAARLLCQSPRGFDGFDLAPVSELTLRKKFEDEKEPGLWGHKVRFYAFTDTDQMLVGLLRECVERDGRIGFQFQFDAGTPGRIQLARDGLGTWLDFKRNYANPPRMEAELLSTETEELALLEELGFACEAVMPESWMHLGRMVDLVLYGWTADWVLARRVPEGGAEGREQ
jgi:hypothetical protein